MTLREHMNRSKLPFMRHYGADGMPVTVPVLKYDWEKCRVLPASLLNGSLGGLGENLFLKLEDCLDFEVRDTRLLPGSGNGLDSDIIAIFFVDIPSDPANNTDASKATEKGKTKIVNLTPHDINFIGENDEVVLTVPSSGVARASSTRYQTGTVTPEGTDLVISLNRTEFGKVENLPDPQEDTIYIVSALTAQAVPERYDLFITDDAVRDENGRIIGCRALARI